MIDVIAQTGKSQREIERVVHPEWDEWMADSVYTHAEARKELGLANGTFYRRIAKEPTTIDRLAMRALYEGLEPFTTNED